MLGVNVVVVNVNYLINNIVVIQKVALLPSLWLTVSITSYAAVTLPPYTTEKRQYIDIDVKRVSNLFRRTKNISPEPDNICGQVLKTCGIFHYIFMQSLKMQKGPKLWKHSIVVPVAEINTKILNDFRRVALLSHEII